MFCLLVKSLVFIILVLFYPFILTNSVYGTALQVEESVGFGKSEEDNVTSTFLNFGQKRNGSHRDLYENFESFERELKYKADILSRLLKININRIRNETDQVELVFLVDASGSVGLENFRNELDFVRKFLSDFTVEPSAARVAVITFGGKRNVKRNIDQISRTGKNDHKCYLLNKQLRNINYTGGGTYTRGALMEALAILEGSRQNAKKVVFLITDGFSNGGDPRPAANLLKNAGATVFTFGIRTGNVGELHDIASSPGYTHSYLLDSFAEFEALARRALHRDLKTGEYVPVSFPDDCNSLCANNSTEIEEQTCCDDLATCACGIATGHYACICPSGYFGSGFRGSCQPCPNGTYASGETSGDSTSICISCPDVNHVTIKVPATSVEHCVCASGFITDGNKCEVITCPKLKVPENGYLVKASACSNVVHAACGVRCRIGFYLTGDSIRLCGRSGIWSGNEPNCLLKTCPALRAPTHGRMRCQHDEDYQHRVTEDSTAYPIDTRCQFRCESGYQLRGSKIRNCLPLSQWDGLKATCKAIKCEPLKRVPHGTIAPESCTGPEKVPFATNCTIICKKGFVLDGPLIRSCGGRTGVWTQRHVVNRCIDKTPPQIMCPADITLNSLPGKNYAHVNWNTPEVSDNADKSPITWSKPYIVFPWKVKIGSRAVIYIAQDSTGNKARCKFKVKVLDNEPPMIENCLDPPIFFTNNQIGVNNVTWDEPGFYDNSKTFVSVKQSHRSGENSFPIGLTKVVYNATDKYNNVASCVLNITVKDICLDPPKPFKGYSNCSSSTNDSTECVLTCDKGYGFADDELSLKCNASDTKWNYDNYIPDCSETSLPKVLSQEGKVVLEGNASIVCDNRTTLRELSEHITADLRSTLLDICGNDIECNLISFDPECEESLISSESDYSNLIRIRRAEFMKKNFHSPGYFGSNNKRTNTVNRLKRFAKANYNADKNKGKTRKKKEKIEIKFKFIGRIIEENFENPREGVQKLKQKIESMAHSGKLNLLSNKTNQEIANLALSLHLVFKDPQELCDPGSVLKKHTCVKCPLGTYYDSSTKHCRPCPFGQYGDTSGSLKCTNCPQNSFTKKMHAKHLQNCIPMCKPGYYSRRKRYQGSHLGLEPCLMCDIGYYQPEYGQTNCLSCPLNTTTHSRGSETLNNCLPISETEINICQGEPCLNGGKCALEDENFSCECDERYVGSKCETFQNPCNSLPCLNEGTCNILSMPNDTQLYSCTCQVGYTGSNCELYVDECVTNPCQNDGKCVSTATDYLCECRDGFEGQFCEIAVDHCDPSPCEEGSTCRTLNETWECFCKPGFLGRHCNLLPCDWLPCYVHSLCINIEEENATRLSYRCECYDGYTGENCTIKVDHCKNSPCINNGECISGTYNYTCNCPVPFTGLNCETELSSDFVMHFTKSGTTDYVSIKGPNDDLSQLTSCLWLQSKDTLNYGTVLSYATRHYDNSFTLTDYNGFVVYINGQKVVTDIKVNDGLWHFFCFTWESRNGFWSIFVDGFVKDNGTGLAKGTIIQGNGSFVIGQEQDRLGGGFSESESFLGKLTLLDVWDNVLMESEMTRMFNTCDKYYGNVIYWSQLQEHVHGDVAILNSQFCQGCPLPVIPFKGNINASDDLSEVTYYCDTGYMVRFRGKEHRALKIKCLKQGQWEGYYIPICTRSKCGFPGYFPRGRIHGRSYLFGDEIHYSCTSGYELRGNPHRICNSEGKWSGIPPICIGKTCKNLLAPENGDIEYIIEENERDDISILQVGQQLEFKCDPGFRLTGETFLTCLESGVWDYDRPACISSGCPPPKQIENAYIVPENLKNFNETYASNGNPKIINDTLARDYYFGDIVGLSCRRGYKFRGNHNLLSEFQLQCSENGTWSGFVPDCVPLNCPWPSAVENGKIFLVKQNNESIEILKNETSPDIMKLRVTQRKNGTGSEENGKLQRLFVPGARVMTICDLGYKLSGEGVRNCTENEHWSPTSSHCEPRECFIENHPYFRILYDEMRLGNDTNIRLPDGDNGWNIKNYYSFHGNLRYFIEGNAYMEKIVFTCRNDTTFIFNNFDINGSIFNLTWTCNANGEWEFVYAKLNNSEFESILNNTIDICQERTCRLPRVPGYGYIVSDSNANNYSRPINNTIIFKCRNGYRLEGNEKSVCLANGSWSSTPFCKPVTCERPPTLLNAMMKRANAEIVNYTFGNMITYQCVPGYVMLGQPSARCLANGKWSRLYSKCSKQSCNKPKLPPGATVHGRSYLYQDQLTYICPNNRKRGVITCKADGNWSDPPDCNDI